MKRNFGLDVMRAVAILMVLFDHAWYFNTHVAAELNPWVVFGFIGVELFFVLSGFLIGQIVLRDLILGINRQKIFSFYIRRWLRTLPLYYVVLIVFIFASNYIYHTSELHPFHFVFLQNFIPSELYFLSIAWSLAIEEWFYIVLPLLLFPFFRKNQSPRRMMPITIASILTVVAVRILFAYFIKIDFEHIRRLIPLRFDSLLLGVLLAVIKVQYSKIYKLLASPMIFLSGLFGLGVFGYYYVFLTATGSLDASFTFKGIGFTLVSIAAVALIPYLEKSDLINSRLSKCKPIFVFLSLTSAISYSLYLTHLEIFTFLIKFLTSKIPAIPLFTLSVVISYCVAYVTYYFFELPIMKLRNKLTRL